MDAFEVIEKLAAGGFATFLVAILVAGKYKVWVWGHQLADMLKEKNAQLEYERSEKEQWRGLALAGRELTDRSVGLAASVVRHGKS